MQGPTVDLFGGLHDDLLELRGQSLVGRLGGHLPAVLEVPAPQHAANSSPPEKALMHRHTAPTLITGLNKTHQQQCPPCDTGK